MRSVFLLFVLVCLSAVHIDAAKIEPSAAPASITPAAPVAAGATSTQPTAVGATAAAGAAGAIPPLPAGTAPVAQLTASQLTAVLAGHSHIDILLEFYAPWCHFCRDLAPVYERVGYVLGSAQAMQALELPSSAKAPMVAGVAPLAAQPGQRILVAKFNCEAPGNMQVCRAFFIRGYPTVRLLHWSEKDGEAGGYRDYLFKEPRRTVTNLCQFAMTSYKGLVYRKAPPLDRLLTAGHVHQHQQRQPAAAAAAAAGAAASAAAIEPKKQKTHQVAALAKQTTVIVKEEASPNDEAAATAGGSNAAGLSLTSRFALLLIGLGVIGAAGALAFVRWSRRKKASRGPALHEL